MIVILIACTVVCKIHTQKQITWRWILGDPVRSKLNRLADNVDCCDM